MKHMEFTQSHRSEVLPDSYDKFETRLDSGFKCYLRSISMSNSRQIRLLTLEGNATSSIQIMNVYECNGKSIFIG